MRKIKVKGKWQYFKGESRVTEEEYVELTTKPAPKIKEVKEDKEE